MDDIKGDNFDDEEIIIDDDLDTPISSSPKTIPNTEDIIVEDVLLEVELPLDEESKRKLQKKDLIDIHEQYDVELNPHEENIPITSEVFKDETFVDNVEIKFPKDIITENESKPKSIPLKKPIIEETYQNPKIDIPNEPEIISEDSDSINDDIKDFNAEDEYTNEEEIMDEHDIEEIEPISQEEDLVDKGKTETESKTIDDKKEENIPNYEVTDLDEKIENKEFISRHDAIFSETTGLDTYKPPKPLKQPKTDEEIVQRKNNVAIMFMVILSTFVIIVAYFIFSNYEPPNAFKTNIPVEAMEMLTEEYFFITSIEEFLIEINENVEKERILIDNYVSGITTKEDTIKDLNVVLKTKENLEVLYEKIMPIENDVIETKKLSNKIFQNTISTTNDIISKINNNEPKVKIVENFNNHVDTNNSNIYMYNQYVQSVFRRYGISVTIDGDKFVLDTSWLKDTN